MSESPKKPIYGDDSIDVIKGEVNQVRAFPRIHLGSDDLEGARHTFLEIMGNALDEAASGFGDKLIFELKSDNTMRVRDFGRGIPLGFNTKHNMWNHEAIFERLYGGGKYDTQEEALSQIENWSEFRWEDYPNLDSIGTHGIGSAATQMTSEFLEVRSFRDGECKFMRFEKGYSLWDEPQVEGTDEPNGTEIIWRPDTEVFKNISIGSAWIKGHAEDISIVASIDVEFIDPDGNSTLFKASSIAGYVHDKTGTEDVAYGESISYDKSGKFPRVCTSEVALAPVTTGTPIVRLFQNRLGVFNDRGANADAVSQAIVDFFKSISKASDVNLIPRDFTGLLHVVVASRANKPNYAEGQTKKLIKDDNVVTSSVYNAVRSLLEREKSKSNSWVEDVVEHAINAARARIQLAADKKLVSEVTKVTSSKRALPDKFVSCRNYEQKNSEAVELWIAEGNSAAGGLQEARDAESQAIFAIRGKSLNMYKASLERMLNNKESQDIIQILGAGVDPSAGLNENMSSFKMEKLRVNGVYIAADADSDGYHIRMLVAVMFWRLFPELIRAGMLHVVETPIRSVLHKGERKYFYTEKEYQDWVRRNNFSGKSYRYKGLGSIDDVDVLHDAMNPATRRTWPVQFDPDDPEIHDVFSALFGTSTDRRKRAVFEGLLGENVSYDDLVAVLDELEDEVAKADIEDVREYEEVIYRG